MRPFFKQRTAPAPGYDLIGDVHGCIDEVTTLLTRLGYEPVENRALPPGLGDIVYTHPDGRQAVFVGDLVDRGPGIVESLRLAAAMVAGGTALCVQGNHENKLYRQLQGRNVRISPDLQASLDQIKGLPPEERKDFKDAIVPFLESLPFYLVLDDGNLLVSHAGLKASLQGKVGKKVEAFCLYGDTTGEVDAHGYPIRRNWAARYTGHPMVVYGHTPVETPRWENNTINLDTGCVFGGSLTALRYPERELVSVPAAAEYWEKRKAFA
jgi:protein phosphatase